LTRRLTLAMVGMVAATLAVSGVMTFLLTQARAARTTETSLVRQLQGLDFGGVSMQQFLERMAARQARTGRTTTTTGPQRNNGQRFLDSDGCPVTSMRRALQVREAGCVLVDPNGTVQVAEGYAAIAGLPDQLDTRALSTGSVLHGVGGGSAWAAKAVLSQPRPGNTGLPVIVLARDVTSELAPVRRWLAVAAVITLGSGVLVAWWLGRRLAHPLKAAQLTTSRIAAGDLSARLPEDGGRDELSTLARSINQMAGSLERARGMEQQFLLSVSHDLRTPLTSIKGYAEALADGTLDDVSRGAGIIQQEAARLERLVRDLLELARLETRQFRLELHPVDLVMVGQQVTQAFATEADNSGLRLTFRGPQAPLHVTADGDRLGQVAANLVENALKYAISGVDVAVGAEGARCWLSVTDDGPGVAPEDAPHIFERLYVASHRPTRKETGSGLGLAIVRELVTALGGHVEAQPAQPRGTHMIVWLPVAGPPAGPESRTAARSAAGSAPAPEPASLPSGQ
jgi:two-component system sensor histidine kinase BaeS